MSKMKKSPYKILVCVVDKGKENLVLGILKNAHETVGISNFVETIQKLSTMNNIMGLARTQQVMITTFVRRENATRTLQALDLVLCPDEKSFGVAFTINLSSISREALNYVISKKVV